MSDDQQQNKIGYGEQCQDESHDHRYNTGDDRTPAQKDGDASRRK
jgi:hypothetical protein